jgi:hypothetical protein
VPSQQRREEHALPGRPRRVSASRAAPTCNQGGSRRARRLGGWGRLVRTDEAIPADSAPSWACPAVVDHGWSPARGECPGPHPRRARARLRSDGCSRHPIRSSNGGAGFGVRDAIRRRTLCIGTHQGPVRALLRGARGPMRDRAHNASWCEARPTGGCAARADSLDHSHPWRGVPADPTVHTARSRGLPRAGLRSCGDLRRCRSGYVVQVAVHRSHR